MNILISYLKGFYNGSDILVILTFDGLNKLSFASLVFILVR